MTSSGPGRAVGDPPHTRRMQRRMKGLAIVLLSAGLLLAVSPAAWADYSATDPDDSDTIDLATVSANRLTGARIRFRADFYETIRWGLYPVTTFHVDSRSGAGPDRYVEIRKSPGEVSCLVLGRRFRTIARLAAVVGGDHVACRIRRSWLDSDGSAIRWRVTAIYLDEVPGPSADETPSNGWFPHA